MWEIADQAQAGAIILLRKQAQIVGEPDEPFEQLRAVTGSSKHYIGVCEPERAGEERTLLASDAIVHLVSGVAEHEAVAQQLALDGRHRACDPGVVNRQEPTCGMRSSAASRAAPP